MDPNFRQQPRQGLRWGTPSGTISANLNRNGQSYGTVALHPYVVAEALSGA